MKLALALVVVFVAGLVAIQPTWAELAPGTPRAEARAAGVRFESSTSYRLFTGAAQIGPTEYLHASRADQDVYPVANEQARAVVRTVRVRSAVLALGALFGLLGALGLSRGVAKLPFVAFAVCAGAGGVDLGGSRLALVVSVPLAVAFAVLGARAAGRR